MNVASATGQVSPLAKIADGCRIASTAIIHDNVVLGENSVVGDYAILGHPAAGKWAGNPLVIAPNALIRSHTVIYEGSTIGSFLETGHHVVLREGSLLGENSRIGSFADIEGDCRIGDFARLHSYAHVGRGSRIGDFVWLYSLTTLMNDPLPPSRLVEPVMLGDMVTVCVNAQLLPGAVISDGCMLASGARVGGYVPPCMVVSGPEGADMRPISFVMHMASRTRHPWHRHFTDAYPEHARIRIKELGAKIDALANEKE